MAERPPLLKRTARNQIPTRAGGYSIHEFHSFPESRFLEHEPGHRNSEPASTKKRSLLWPASPSGIRSTGLQPLLLLFVAFLLFFLFSVTLMLRLLLLVLLLRLRLPLDARVLLLWPLFVLHSRLLPFRGRHFSWTRFAYFGAGWSSGVALESFLPPTALATMVLLIKFPAITLTLTVSAPMRQP